MLFFLPTFSTRQPLDHGLVVVGEPYRLASSLDEARRVATAPDGTKGKILVLDATALTLSKQAPPSTRAIPPGAVLNVDAGGTYWPPRAVEAAGGLVVRPGDGEPDLLLIFRRGVWDLPKGKLDRGETPEAAAVREVAEEVGIDEAAIERLADAGQTVHGYLWPRKKAYAVKTTHWYAMRTTATTFEPQHAEDIEAVAWTPWSEALKKLGFETLREHLAGLDPSGWRSPQTG